MTTKNESRLKMYQSVADFLVKNTQLIQTLPEFPGLQTALQTNIALVMQIIKEQSGDNSGIVITKRKGKEQLEKKAVDLAGKMTAYAMLKGNEILLKSVSLRKSSFHSMSDLQRASLALSLSDKAAALLPELEPYAVNQEEIDGLRQVCNDFIANIPKSKEVFREKVQTNHEMLDIIQQTDVILKKMDALMLILKASNPAVYEHYLSTRRISKTGNRGQAMRIKVTDTATGKGIKGVNVTINSGNGNGILERMTATKGGIVISTIETGSYLVSAAKEGFTTVAQNVHIVKGEFKQLQLQLSPF